MPITCEKCSRANPQFKCNKCDFIHYCSRDCQVADWRRHRPKCSEIEQLSKLADTFTYSALKNIAFKAYSAAMYSYHKAKFGPGHLVVTMLDSVGAICIEPLQFSTDEYIGTVLYCTMRFEAGVFENYMSVYTDKNDTMHNILTVEHGDRLFDNFGSYRFTHDPKILVIGGSKYCAISASN